MIFEIPKILDSENIVPELVSKEIMSYWKNKILLDKGYEVLEKMGQEIVESIIKVENY